MTTIIILAIILAYLVYGKREDLAVFNNLANFIGRAKILSDSPTECHIRLSNGMTIVWHKRFKAITVAGDTAMIAQHSLPTLIPYHIFVYKISLLRGKSYV
jgi:hypothetical protein